MKAYVTRIEDIKAIRAHLDQASPLDRMRLQHFFDVVAKADKQEVFRCFLTIERSPHSTILGAGMGFKHMTKGILLSEMRDLLDAGDRQHYQSKKRPLRIDNKRHRKPVRTLKIPLRRI